MPTATDALEPGWFQRQADAATAAVRSWPAWKRREAGIDHLFPEADSMFVTELECWSAIIECTRVGNWAGVEARAREGVHVLGVRPAEGLVWAVRTRSVPRWRITQDGSFMEFVIRDLSGPPQDRWPGHYYKRESDVPFEELVAGWKWVINKRAALIEYYHGSLLDVAKK